MTYHLEDFDPEASNIELKAMPRDEIEKLLGLLARRGEPPRVDRRERKVPFRHGSFRDFRADRPLDLVCLARSPTYTPRGADAIFDVVRERFIDESATAAFVRELGT